MSSSALPTLTAARCGPIKGPVGNTHCEAVALAARDLTPCRLGTAKGKAEGVSQCRRVIKDGQAWNRWQLAPSERDKYPAEGHPILSSMCWR